MVLTGEAGLVLIDPQQISDRTSILKTCRQVRHEASGIFYAENSFEVALAPDDSECLVAWLRSIAPPHLQLISRLGVTFTIHELVTKLVEQFFNGSDPHVSSTEKYERKVRRPIQALAVSIVSVGLNPTSVRGMAQKTAATGQRINHVYQLEERGIECFQRMLQEAARI